MGLHWALEVLAAHDDWDAELIDLRSLAPIDWDTLHESVRKTGRVLVLHEDVLTGGIGGEIAAVLQEENFRFLDAPVLRLGSEDLPVPFAAELEAGFLASARLERSIEKLLQY